MPKKNGFDEWAWTGHYDARSNGVKALFRKKISEDISISYYNVKRGQEEKITSCEGDLIVICNALADYAELLEKYLQNDKKRKQIGFCGIMQYERIRDRCWKVTTELQEQIGYNRNLKKKI